MVDFFYCQQTPAQFADGQRRRRHGGTRRRRGGWGTARPEEGARHGQGFLLFGEVGFLIFLAKLSMPCDMFLFLTARGELFHTFIEQADMYLSKPPSATTQHGE